MLHSGHTGMPAASAGAGTLVAVHDCTQVLSTHTFSTAGDLGSSLLAHAVRHSCTSAAASPIWQHRRLDMDTAGRVKGKHSRVALRSMPFHRLWPCLGARANARRQPDRNDFVSSRQARGHSAKSLLIDRVSAGPCNLAPHITNWSHPVSRAHTLPVHRAIAACAHCHAGPLFQRLVRSKAMDLRPPALRLPASISAPGAAAAA